MSLIENAPVQDNMFKARQSAQDTSENNQLFIRIMPIHGQCKIQQTMHPCLHFYTIIFRQTVRSDFDRLNKAVIRDLMRLCTMWRFAPINNDDVQLSILRYVYVVAIMFLVNGWRINSTNFDKSSQVVISNIAQKKFFGWMKASNILSCNSEYFWRYSNLNVLFYITFLLSRLTY